MGPGIQEGKEEPENELEGSRRRESSGCPSENLVVISRQEIRTWGVLCRCSQSLLWLQTSLRVSGCESRRRPEAEPFRHAGFRVRRGVLGPASGSVGCGGFVLLLS